MSWRAAGRLATAVLASVVLSACARQPAGGGGPSAGGAPAPYDDVIVASQPDRPPERVMLISISGLEARHYGFESDGLNVRRAPMPNLARLATLGAFADAVTPVMPPDPYPVHATLVTGRRPDQHGLLGIEILGPNGLSLERVAVASRIRGVTLWKAAQAAGRAVAALGWPSTRGARIELLLPDLGLVDRAVPWLDSLKPFTTDWVHDRIARILAEEPEVINPSGLQRDEIVSRLVCEIVAEPTTPGLWLLGFQQGASAASVFGPETEAERLAYRNIDRELVRILHCLEDAGLLPSTAILVVGDRSLQPVHTVAYPNVALEQAGLITKGPPHPGVGSATGIARWSALTRTYGGSGVVYAVDEESAMIARRALEELARSTAAFRVVSAAELAALHADPNAWFGLEALPGYLLAGPIRGLRVQASPLRGSGGYLPKHGDGGVGFVAWGAGIQSGVRIPVMDQLDIAPTAAALLGFELLSAQGRPVVGIMGALPPPGFGSP